MWGGDVGFGGKMLRRHWVGIFSPKEVAGVCGHEREQDPWHVRGGQEVHKLEALITKLIHLLRFSFYEELCRAGSLGELITSGWLLCQQIDLGLIGP